MPSPHACSAPGASQRTSRLDKRLYDIQTRHLRYIIEALHMLDLRELQRQAETHGTAADRELIAGALAALEVLPGPHG